MARYSLLVLLTGACLTSGFSQKPNPFAGRWDIEVSPTGSNARTYPDWLEVADKNGATTLRIQPRSGSVFSVTDFKIEGSHLSVTWPHAADAKTPAVTWELDITEDRLNGMERRG